MIIKQINKSLFYSSIKNKKLLISTYPFRVLRINKSADINKNLISELTKNKIITSADIPNYFSLELIFSTNCNLSCTYCYAKEKKTGCYGLPITNMDKDIVKKAINFSLSNLVRNIKLNKNNSGVFDLYFMGGEPLLNRDVLYFTLRYVHLKTKEIKKKYNLNIKVQPAISTNGVLINNKDALFFRKYNFIYIGITIDGRHHNKYRKFSNGKGTLEIILNKIKLLTKNKVNLKIVSVVPPGDVKNINKNLNFFKSLGLLSKARRVSILPRAPNTNELFRSCPVPQITMLKLKRKQQSLRYSIKEKEIFAKNIIEMSKKFNIDERDLKRKMFELINTGGSKYHCPAGIWKISVIPDGSIYPCHQLVNIKKFYMGNLALINNRQKRFNKVRKYFLKRTVFKIDKCKKCLYQTICPPLVDCPARSLLEEKNLYKTPQYCNIYFPYIKNVFQSFISLKIIKENNHDKMEKN